ncbi:MAG: nucleotidyltransferase domain-containing protein [SAR202 cluster bacterium]|nr:nucleotidyltransferase domain-containing protein [SAR202 cluster bacterium]
MEATINTWLADIEAEEDVTIVYACESGSRAWGFPSADSDYDVRFIYLHRIEWYLSISAGRDVIERPISGLLDVNGWDLKKALQLYRKSNPVLFEWLNSPIVYRDTHSVAEKLRDLSSDYYSSTAGAYHYLQMAQGNAKDLVRGGGVRIKKYFYVLRPLLAVNWIKQGRGVVPTEFDALVDRIVTSSTLRFEIEKPVAAKRLGEE